MNKLVPFKKFSKKVNLPVNSGTSVMVDEKGVPLGFVFGRDAFVSFLQHLDNEFEKNIPNSDIAFNNPAGKLIDLIEEKLPVNPKFKSELKDSIKSARKTRWIPLDEIASALNV